ncbi:hypothetical protein HNR01_005485 [Methylorubrum rhodesianum]|nr:hypothetical protein [Methylorubrum rhodesianum]
MRGIGLCVGAHARRVGPFWTPILGPYWTPIDSHVASDARFELHAERGSGEWSLLD